MFNSVFGRNLILAMPILALGACSALEQPYLSSGADAQYGHYDQGCSTGACAPGQGYSVAGQAHGAHGGAIGSANHWPDKNLVAGYEHGGAFGQGPVPVNPAGYGPQGPHHAGIFGQPPHLRGLRGPQRGNFYGTVGGVMYDTDIDSFGLEGRVGYNSGHRFLGGIWGAEVEGSVGVFDEKETINDPDLGDVELTSGFDYNVAAFAISRVPLTQRLSLHGRGGYDFRRLTVSGEAETGENAEVNVDFDGFAYGIGAEYAMSPRSGLRLDLTEYRNEIGGTQSVSASYVHKF